MQEISYLRIKHLDENALTPKVSWYAKNVAECEDRLLQFAVEVSQQGGDDPLYLNKTLPLRQVSHMTSHSRVATIRSTSTRRCLYDR